MEDYQGVIFDYIEVIKIDFNNSSVYNNCGIVFF